MYSVHVHVYVGRKAWISTIRGLPCTKHVSMLCASHPWIDPRLRMHDEREGSLLATWPVLGTAESN